MKRTLCLWERGREGEGGGGGGGEGREKEGDTGRRVESVKERRRNYKDVQKNEYYRVLLTKRGIQWSNRPLK